MYGNRKTKSIRTSQLIVDVIHVVVCILIVALAVLAFLNPVENDLAYPVIFFLAAVLNGIEAAGKLKRDHNRKKQKAAGIAFALAAFALLLLTLLSAVSVWR